MIKGTTALTCRMLNIKQVNGENGSNIIRRTTA